MSNLEILKSIAEQLMSQPTVDVEGQSILVKRTSSNRLRMVSFELDGRQYDAIEQNREKPSRWVTSLVKATKSFNFVTWPRTSTSPSRLTAT